jgi:peroxiredoxin
MTSDNLPGPDHPVPDPASDTHTPTLTPDDPPMPTRKRWVVAALAALGVALFAVPLLRGPGDHVAAGGETKAETTTAAAGPSCAAKERANFDFTLKDAKGADVKLSAYKGKVVLLNFWATWCGPCKVEIPEFVEAYQKYRDKGFVILGVLSEDDPSAADLQAFMAEHKMNYPVLRQHDGVDAAFGPLWALPTSFIIDRNGGICTKHMGPVSKEMLEREISGLL